MRKSRGWILGSVLLVALLVLGVSCAKKAVRVDEEAAQPGVEETVVVEEETVVVEEIGKAPTVEVGISEESMRRLFERESIHFDFDQYVLKPEAMRILDKKADYLRAHPEARVLIEGHCDERGTNEYNLALGDRRANSAKDYLMKSGVAESRMTTISYGEERPVCTESMESCWWRNRRDNFMLR
jgi:peptidoglycan-associated lipoprotein